MRTQDIYADTVEEAAEKILEVLMEDNNATRSVSSRDNVFYFNGWDGLGASAVLRVIAQCLTETSADAQTALAELGFEQVIHVDCSMWESRRALQRAVAEQLKLPDRVMEMFNRQEEEDDFHGVAQGSRGEIQQVVREMHQHIQKMNLRFLLIFHNGSSDEIDLASFCGFPLSGFSTSKALWTFQGRFRLKPRKKADMAMSAGTTDAFLSATLLHAEEHVQHERWSDLVCHEASEVVASCRINSGPRGITNDPAEVAECFLYMLELCFSGRHSIDYDLATHGANYWICDGIIQKQRGRNIGTDDHDGLWRAADALQRQMRLDVDYHQHLPYHLRMCAERKPYWTSPTCGCAVPTGAIPNYDMFQHYMDKLNVLKLSRCAFDFHSPPFLCCHNLRFLWLEHCQSTRTSTDGAGKEDICRFFQSLWVLDMRYTNCAQILSAQMLDLMTQLRELNVMGAQSWDIGQLQGRLPNICRLRIKESNVSCSCPENDLFSKMNKLELLDFSGNNKTYVLDPPMTSLSGPRPISNLETVTVYGCEKLQHISFRGCSKLKNLLLGGRMPVRTLDISGAAVKTLDLTATEMRGLCELSLLDCEKLCAILWPPKDKMTQDLAKLCIDTMKSAPSAQSEEVKGKRGASSEFDWYISVGDARLLASLEPVYSSSRGTYVEVSSPARPTVSAGCSKEEGIKSRNSYEQQQVLVNPQKASEGIGDAPGMMCMWTWHCPDVPDLPRESCYMHIRDQTRTQEVCTITVPKFVTDCWKILHVHDSMSITTLPFEWHMLEWCRIERCPGLNDGVFGSEETGAWNHIKWSLRTFWASQLAKARYIWKWSEPFRFYRTFPNLTFLHLDCCPMLVHVLPLSAAMIDDSRPSFDKLETLEIMWCGDLQEVFPLDTNAKDCVEDELHPVTLDFPDLKHIHLLELPSLQRICGVRMSTPNLETIKIRGCWSLTRLPHISGSNKVVECDCEKEWWDKLEWDDGSQVSRYKPIHSQYYKKTLLRRSVLN